MGGKKLQDSTSWHCIYPSLSVSICVHLWLLLMVECLSEWNSGLGGRWHWDIARKGDATGGPDRRG